jgi:predicted nucleotidyltransferase
MATLTEIEILGREIGEEFGPERVLLFGSHVRGEATKNSDVDILVIMPDEESPLEKAVEIRLRIRPAFPIDILVRTPEEISRRIEMGDCFMLEIMSQGKTLYEAPDARVD